MIVEKGFTGPLCQFIADLASLEFDSMKRVKKIYVMDYGILMNPEESYGAFGKLEESQR